MAKRKNKTPQNPRLARKQKHQSNPPATTTPVENLNQTLANHSRNDLLKLAQQYHGQNRLNEAAVLYTEILKRDPDDVQVLFFLGTLLSDLKEYKRAIGLLVKAVDLKPDFAEAYNNLGRVYDFINKYAQACEAFQKAIEYKDNYLMAYFNLACVLKKTQHGAAAMAMFDKVLALEPDNKMSLLEAAPLKFMYGYPDDAIAYYEKHYELTGDISAKMSRDMLMPIILPATQEGIQHIRNEHEHILDQYIANPPKVKEPQKFFKRMTFRLAFHAQNNVTLMQKTAKLHETICPDLCFIAPHCQENYQRKTGNIRIGFVSKYFYNHSVSRCYGELIRALAQQDNFDVYIVSTEFVGIKDKTTEKIYEHCAGDIVLNNNSIHDAQQKIASLELDILIYTEIGMDQMAYCLAMGRQAPIQCVLAGHPDTSGIDVMDYFLSAKVVEPPDNPQAHYSETLIMLDHIPQCMERGKRPDELKTKTELELPEDKNIYACPMKMQKLHPDFDRIFAEILQKDPNGVIVLFKDNGRLAEILWERFAKTMPPDIIDRMLLVPWADANSFPHYILHSDVVLDPFHFGGGTTNFIVLNLGTPVVTWPGEFMRGLGAFACHTRMGLVDEMVAKRREDYADLAVKIVTNKQYNQELREKILQRCDVLFGCEAIDECITLFNDLAKQHNIIS